MQSNFIIKMGVAVMLTMVISSCKKVPRCYDDNNPYVSVKSITTGLNNPRGLKFGPDGHLYVAEGGVGGTTSTEGQCTQEPPPLGPYLGSATGGRVSRVTWDGARATVTDQLPSSITKSGEVQGVSDVAFAGHTLYALLAGGGCFHGVPSIPNGIFKINSNGSWSMLADLTSWFHEHPVARPGVDFDPDGTPYSMEFVNGSFYVIEPNHGDFVKVSLNGSISRQADISASQGHIVPTAQAYHMGNFYVGNLNPFPITDGSSSIYKITPGGDVSVWATGFTTVLGVAFDKAGRLYVLENTTANLFPTPGTGKVIRVDHWGNRETIASGLNFPTAMTFGPDEKLYISNKGFGPDSFGGGEVLQVSLKNCEGDDLQLPPAGTASGK